MNHNLTTQEKINTLKAKIQELKETRFSSFEQNEKDFLIDTLQQKIDFLNNDLNMNIQIDAFKAIIKEGINQTLNEFYEKLKVEKKTQRDQFLKSQYENKGL